MFRRVGRATDGTEVVPGERRGVSAAAGLLLLAVACGSAGGDGVQRRVAAADPTPPHIWIATQGLGSRDVRVDPSTGPRSVEVSISDALTVEAVVHDLEGARRVSLSGRLSETCGRESEARERRRQALPRVAGEREASGGRQPRLSISRRVLVGAHVTGPKCPHRTVAIAFRAAGSNLRGLSARSPELQLIYRDPV